MRSLSDVIFNLEFYGNQKIALKLFLLYLNAKTEIVDINCVKSSRYYAKIGVPQGCIRILDPFLFLVYLNDLYFVYNFYATLLFADDISLT